MARNLLWITADQWRADFLGAAMRHPVHTPNLDALAARAVLFDRHYAQSAPCGPSRASLHTGTYPWQHGSWRNGQPGSANAWNWALELAKEGFATALVGYTHTSLDPSITAAERLVPRGFQGILPGLNLQAELTVDMEEWRGWHAERAGGPPPPVVIKGSANGYVWGQAGHSFSLSDTAYVAEQAAKFLNNRPAQPWALHVTFFRPHDPYVVASDLMEFTENPGDLEPIPAHPHDELGEVLRAATERNRPPSPAEIRVLRRYYRASVAEMDLGIGLLLNALADAGADKDTLVIVTSDHGDQLGDHGLMNKLGVYDQSYRVPLIICLPDAPDEARGRVISAMTQAIDLVPTVFDCLLGDPGPPLPGRSLKPWVLGMDPANWRTEALWGYEYRPASQGADASRLYAARTANHLFAMFDDLPPLLIDYRNGGETRWHNCVGCVGQERVEADLRAALAQSGVTSSW